MLMSTGECRISVSDVGHASMVEANSQVAGSANTVDRISSDRLHDHRAYRLSAVDMVRGLVIVIMAIDHVRTIS